MATGTDVRRLFLILLLCLLPMQIVWASVSSYCQHEQTAGTAHVGHHDHEHTPSGLDADDGPGASLDTDCDYCHHACSNVISASIRANCTPCRAAPPSAGLAQYRSFIGDIAHPPDI